MSDSAPAPLREITETITETFPVPVVKIAIWNIGGDVYVSFPQFVEDIHAWLTN